ncbi:glycosyltransferase [Aerococcus urinaeequi]|uniref:glycosyltransferase n=1 Tax=Aerococcus urinaeequi TaxID=51665 RepID=UPI003B3BBB6D
MTTIFSVIFGISLFIIFWGNIGYQLSLIILDKIFQPENEIVEDYYPTVTIMVVAHNEEYVIHDKLLNLDKLNYPKNKLNILIASDNSTDRTNEIVEKYIEQNPNKKIELYKSKRRMGKTNAQNEAQKKVQSEFLVMTDANSMLDKDSIRFLMSSFESNEIVYVTGKLVYTNSFESETSSNESIYWKLDLRIREIESNFQTITAGNGALYAVRNEEYIDFAPMKSHDSSMPLYYGLKGKRAIANHDAIAYEKAGENTKDEFNRKVRMNRMLLHHILPSVKILNIFKLKWFTYFYLGHRTCRYLLWLAHLLLLISNLFLASISNIIFYIAIVHLLVLTMGILQHFIGTENKMLNLVYYYLVTITAQYKGIFNTVTGKSKPFWEKAESAR